jgi:outer membrane lipoprotein carrier protein
MKRDRPSRAARRAFLGCVAAVAAAACGVPGAAAARSDAVATLRAFVQEVQSASASFTQTVTSPDGTRTKSSSGTFAFVRPDRFRFEYLKPYRQTVVADGAKVWFHDPDLEQVSVRPMSRALGATPAALLAGRALDTEFDLRSDPDAGGLAWVRATPKAKDGPFESVRIGFRGQTLAAIEIVDGFGQRSRIEFGDLVVNPKLPPETFRFVVPPGADVVEQ